MIANEPDLPKTWRSPHLGDVSEVRYGLGQPPEQADDGVPMIRATNVKRGRISEEGLIRIKRSAISESRNPYLKATDVVVVRSGAYTGDVAMVTEKWAGSVAGYDLVVSPGTSIDSGFCAYALLSSSVQQHFKGQSNRAAPAHLNRQQLQTTPIPLPPLPEQKKIAHILSTVQRAIEAQERIIQTTTELKKALMHKLFTEGLRNEPRKHTEIGPVPESWEVVELGRLTSTVYRYPTYYKIEYVETGVPEVRGELLTPNGEIETDQLRIRFISESTAKRFPRVRLEPGDIVMSVRGTMGKIGIVPVELSGGVITANLIRLAPRRETILPDYFRWAMPTPRFIAALNAASPQTTIRTITAPALKELLLPVPQMDEQREIVPTIHAVESKLAAHTQRTRALQDLFRTLLHELMTAKTRVTELSLESHLSSKPPAALRNYA